MVTLSACPPVIAEDGARVVMVGVGGTIAKVKAFETVVPFEAVSEAEPG